MTNRRAFWLHMYIIASNRKYFGIRHWDKAINKYCYGDNSLCKTCKYRISQNNEEWPWCYQGLLIYKLIKLNWKDCINIRILALTYIFYNNVKGAEDMTSTGVTTNLIEQKIRDICSRSVCEECIFNFKRTKKGSIDRCLLIKVVKLWNKTEPI